MNQDRVRHLRNVEIQVHAEHLVRQGRLKDTGGGTYELGPKA